MEGIEALAKPIFVRAQPFNGSGTAAPFNGRWPVPPSLFIQNGFAGLVALRGRGARLPQRGQARLAIGKVNVPGLYFFVGGLEEIKEFSRLYF